MFGRLRRRQGKGNPTFVFADLSGFTSYTERMGDEAAADLAREFRRTMCALSCELDARQIKSMGDGVMIWARDPAAAVEIASRCVADVGTREDLLPVRVGVNTGPAVRRGRDWFGTSVNVAARLAAQAEPNQALISAATHEAVGARNARKVADRRELSLRGVADPVAVWRLA